MINVKRKHHYLPKYYLEGFCDSSGRVWTYKKTEPRNPYANQPDSTAVINEFYWLKEQKNKNDVEDWFEKEVETPAADLFKELRSRKFPDAEGKKLLSLFFGTLMARTPSYIENLKNIQVNENLLLKNMIDLGKISAEQLSKMNWSLIETDGEYPFITSDNIVNIFHPTMGSNAIYQPGLGVPDTRVSIPISNKLSLLLVNHPGFLDGSICSVNKKGNINSQNKTNIKKLIKCLNKTVFIKSDKYVFAGSNSEKLKNCFDNILQAKKLNST